MTEFLLRALYIGLSAASFIVVLRATPLVQRLVQEGRKPFACDVCMSFWSTLGVVGGLVLSNDISAVPAALPAFAITLLTLRKLTEPLRPPGQLPDLEDSE